jgi:hypothetical protein
MYASPNIIRVIKSTDIKWVMHVARMTEMRNAFFFLVFLMPFSGVGFFLFTYGSFRHLVGLLGRGISPAPRPLPTQDNTTQRNTDTHPCPEQDSNLRSQCSSGRRQYLPETARLETGHFLSLRSNILSAPCSQTQSVLFP